uniref:NADH-ubiquinone oxidoreductase chain 2 n=1 Tax=Habrobracon hebetor TaxID=69819 RepID=A0A7D5I5R0_9HYME|nr:NADH dehydrogenase subunit 2 [Habrobracon hebetor]
MFMYMMKFNLFIFFFYIISPFFIFFLNNYYSMWIFLELNLILFLTFMILNNKFLGDKSMKYYLINSLSSMIFLFFMNLNMFNMNFYNLIIMNLMILLKLGMFPFHLWFIDLLMNLTWNLCFYLSTWQKIMPMIILIYFFNMKMLLFISLLASMFSLMMILNQIYLKKFFGYSSINHMSWMLISLMLNNKLLMIYYLIYSMISYLIMKIFLKFNFNEISSLFMINNFKIKLILFFNMLSLGGIPPTYGFLMKWLFMNNLIQYNYILILILIFISLIFFFYYIQLIFNFMLINLFNLKFNLNYLIKNKNLNMFLIFSMFLMLNLLTIIFYI